MKNINKQLETKDETTSREERRKLTTSIIELVDGCECVGVKMSSKISGGRE